MPTITTIRDTLQLNFAGDRVRSGDEVISSRAFKQLAGENNQLFFGRPVQINTDNTLSPLSTTGATPTVTNFKGFAVRVVKQQTSYSESINFYNPEDFVSFLERGTISVVLEEGTPTANGLVYLKKITNGSDVYWGISATATGNTLLPNVKFTTGNVTTDYFTNKNLVSVTVLNRN